MATVLWCYLRNNAFKKDKDYPSLRRPHRPGKSPSGVTIQAEHHQAENGRK